MIESINSVTLKERLKIARLSFFHDKATLEIQKCEVHTDAMTPAVT